MSRYGYCCPGLSGLQLTRKSGFLEKYNMFGDIRETITAIFFTCLISSRQGDDSTHLEALYQVLAILSVL